MYSIVLDVSGEEADLRVRREYERRLPRLDRRYVFDERTDEVRPLAKSEDAKAILRAERSPLSLLFFESRERSSSFIGGHLYLRTNGQDQILGYSVRVPESLRDLLDRVYVEADAAVEKARKRERRRRTARCGDRIATAIAGESA